MCICVFDGLVVTFIREFLAQLIIFNYFNII